MSAFSFLLETNPYVPDAFKISTMSIQETQSETNEINIGSYTPYGYTGT
jgi:hypothetical protein